MGLNYLSDQLLAKLLEVVRWYDAINGDLDGPTLSDSLANNFVPFELTAAPERQDEENPWFAKGKQLYFDEEEGFRLDDSVNDVESEIYFPLSESPSHSSGDRLFCIWRGRWEAVGAPGEASTLHAVVFRAIEYTEPTATLDDSQWGKILPDGMAEPLDADGNIDIDKLPDCRCKSLGKDPSGDNHQQLYKGQRIEVSGPFKRKNPDYDPDDDESTELEYKDYYEAEPIRNYKAKMNGDIHSGDWGTFTEKGGDENDVVMAVSGEGIPKDRMVPGNAEKYDIELINGFLYVNGGPCSVAIDDSGEPDGGSDDDGTP